jgi:hypothetical protein
MWSASKPKPFHYRAPLLTVSSTRVLLLVLLLSIALDFYFKLRSHTAQQRTSRRA